MQTVIKQVLVTGGTGMLGRAVVRRLVDSGHEVTIVARAHDLHRGHAQLIGDLTDPAFIADTIGSRTFDLCVHCAAIVDVDRCELEPRYATDLHVSATEQLSRALHGAPLIYISTDSVFDGTDGNYSEMDATRPLNKYATTKLRGEQVALMSGATLVLRTNIYGVHQLPGQSLVEWALGALRRGESLGGFSNVHFNPLYTGQVADAIAHLVATDLPAVPILHLAADEHVSKAKFLRLLASRFGHEEGRVYDVEYACAAHAAPRPLNTTLDNSHAKSILPHSLSLVDGINMLYEEIAADDHSPYR